MQITVIDRNKGKPGRKPNLWLRYADPKLGYKHPVQEKAVSGVKAMAAQIAELKRQIKAGTWVHPNERKAATILFATFARAVVEKRTAKGVGKNESPPNKTERGVVENHLIPAFGKYTLPELANFRAVLDGFEGRPNDTPEEHATRINHKGLGGRTVRNIHTTLRTIFMYAVDEGIIDTPPPPLQVKRDHIPPPRDKDPEWRKHAKFDRREVSALALCEDVPIHYRTMLITYFLTGPRFNELHEQRVRHYDRDMQPLHALTVRASKLGRHAPEGMVRHVPVHPDLQRWLDWWLDEEWEIIYGRPPQPDDYLFPTLSKRQLNRGIGCITYQEFAYQWRESILPAAGLQSRRDVPDQVRRRERGIHDARRTFIGLMRSAGADDTLVRAMTHKGTGDRVLDMYTHWQWSSLCEQVSRTNLQLPPPPYRKAPIRLVTSGRSSDVGSEASVSTERDFDALRRRRPAKHSKVAKLPKP